MILLEEDIQRLASLGYVESELRELNEKLRKGARLDEFESMLWASVSMELDMPLWFELEGKNEHSRGSRISFGR